MQRPCKEKALKEELAQKEAIIQKWKSGWRPCGK